jgi:DNA-directed RNA polymerase specialized sigma24 family protein
VVSSRVDEPSPNRFEAAARRVLVDRINARSADPESIAVLRADLRRALSLRFPQLDPDDLAQITLLRLLYGKSVPGAAAVGNPRAYAHRIARNAALDALKARSRRRESDLDEAAERAAPFDAITALVDHSVSHAQVVSAMRRLIQGEEARVVRIITLWLDVAEEIGRTPSTRVVAARGRVSHTSVANALKRFRAAMDEEG